MAKYSTRPKSDAGEDVEQQEGSLIADGNEKW
jgi:hypothetical protein